MAKRTPKYSIIADQLIRDIRQGRYQVGERLPTECELMIEFGTSRHTIRNALQVLRTRMIAESRQGSGSRVISNGTEPQFLVSIQSLDELVAYSRESRRQIIESRTVTAGPELAESMRCSTGRLLVRIRVLRTLHGENPLPLSYLNVWIDALYREAIPEFQRDSSSIAEIISNRFCCTTNDVVQTVGAGEVTSEAAPWLGRKKGEPALIIERVYATASGVSAHIYSRSICAANVVKLVSKFRASIG